MISLSAFFLLICVILLVVDAIVTVPKVKLLSLALAFGFAAFLVTHVDIG